MMANIKQLDSLLAQHRQFIVQAQACIKQDLDKPENAQLSELLSRLSSQLTAHLQWIESATATSTPADKAAVLWGPITTTRKPPRKDSRPQLVVTGPSPADHLAIGVSKNDIDQMEAKIQQYDTMSRALQRAAEQHSAIIALHNKGALIRAGDADKDHARITLLKRYNDVRDVAQQLIGIIAEHKQVSIRSLYKDGSFGVTADD